MPNFRRTVCSRCKVLAVVNHVTGVQVHLTSKAFIIKLLHDFSAFILSKQIILQNVCNREHSQQGGDAQLLCLLSAHNFSVTYMLFPKSNPVQLLLECSHGTASRLSGSQEGSLVLCPHCDNPKQCSSFLCLAVAPSVSPTSSPTTRLHSCGSRHVTSYFLQHRPHLLIKLLSLLVLPTEIFCKAQVFILGSNMCRYPYAQVFFSQTLLC